MKSEKELFATIGMKDSEIDRRERLLDAKRKRDDRKELTQAKAHWSKYFN